MRFSIRFRSISFWFDVDKETYCEPMIERQIWPEYNSHFNFEIETSLGEMISGWNSMGGNLKQARVLLFLLFSKSTILTSHLIYQDYPYPLEVQNSNNDGTMKESFVNYLDFLLERIQLMIMFENRWILHMYKSRLLLLSNYSIEC